MIKNIKPLREKLECPLCRKKFIPEAFHYEKTNFEFKSVIANEVEYKDSNRRVEITPYTSFRGAWITFCPGCNYLIKFCAAIGRRDHSDNLNSKTYNYIELNKPYMDYSDYFREKYCEITDTIKQKLDETNIDDWGLPYKDWRENKTSDGFKFLIKFYANIENYSDSIVEDKDKPMKEKISELPVDNEIIELLENIRLLRNKLAHDNYELSQEDELFIDSVYSKFLLELTVKQLKILKLDNIRIEEELNFINKEQLIKQIRGFLGLYTHMKTGLQDFHKRFYLPLLQKLGIGKKSNYIIEKIVCYKFNHDLSIFSFF